MANILGLVGLGCCAAAVLFTLLAVALPYWQTVDVQNVLKINAGLWRYCVEQPGSEMCGDPLDDVSAAAFNFEKSALRATRAMVLLGFFCTIGSLVGVILLLFVLKGRKILGFVSGGLAIAAGLFLMIGMAIYVDKIKTDLFDYNAGFVFVILGWLVSWAAGALIFFMSIKGSEAN